MHQHIRLLLTLMTNTATTWYLVLYSFFHALIGTHVSNETYKTSDSSKQCVTILDYYYQRFQSSCQCMKTRPLAFRLAEWIPHSHNSAWLVVASTILSHTPFEVLMYRCRLKSLTNFPGPVTNKNMCQTIWVLSITHDPNLTDFSVPHCFPYNQDNA